MDAVTADPGQDSGGAPDLMPPWTMLDSTPKAGNADWYPKLDDGHLPRRNRRQSMARSRLPPGSPCLPPVFPQHLVPVVAPAARNDQGKAAHRPPHRHSVPWGQRAFGPAGERDVRPIGPPLDRQA